MHVWKLITILLLSLINFGQAANILGMLPYPLYSHTRNYMPIFRALAAKGHNVTLVTAFPSKVPVPNINEIVMPSVWDKLKGLLPNSIFDYDGVWFRLTGLMEFGIDGATAVLELPEMQALIKSDVFKFDLIITETFFCQEPFAAFGHKFNAPVINLMSTFMFPLNAHYTGNYLPVTYIPVMHFAISDHMAFHERLVTSFFYMFDILGGEVYLSKQESIMRKYFNYPGSESLPPLRDMLRNTSLTLTNQHLAIGYPMPLQKNIVYFAGTDIKKPEPLPKDLQEVMDSAKDGVVYLSFGSFFNFEMLPPHITEAIFSAIGKTKYKVLMKVDNPSLFKKYQKDHIVMKKWFPQVSVLAHPNCKVFISHCGVNGLMEAMYYARPMVAVPLAADQKVNAKFLENVGMAEVVFLNSITETKLLNAINMVLSDTKYKKNAEIRSEIFRDNPLDIMDNVIYWIEYVIRHKGAPHLRPAALDLHWYQYIMLDLIAFYLFSIILVLYILIKVLKLGINTFSRFFCTKSVKSYSKKSKRE